MNKSLSNYKIYRPPITNLFPLLLFRWNIIALIIIIPVIYEVLSHPEEINRSQWLLILFTIFLIIVILFQIYSILGRYLIVIPEGIFYHGVGFSIYAKWDDIIWISEKFNGLIVTNPGTVGHYWMRYLIENGNQNNYIIPMKLFDSNWQEHELGKYILSKITNKNLRKWLDTKPWRI